jgi:hypothetical protein
MNQLSKLLFKIYLYLKNRFDPTPPATDEEIFCTDICLSLIGMENSRLTYAPISNKRFIKNDTKEIFVVIDHRVINLINHVYGYNIMIEDDHLFNSIIGKFDDTLENKRLELEAEMKQNIKHSLQNILDKVKS